MKTVLLYQVREVDYYKETLIVINFSSFQDIRRKYKSYLEFRYNDLYEIYNDGSEKLLTEKDFLEAGWIKENESPKEVVDEYVRVEMIRQKEFNVNVKKDLERIPYGATGIVFSETNYSEEYFRDRFLELNKYCWV